MMIAVVRHARSPPPARPSAAPTGPWPRSSRRASRAASASARVLVHERRQQRLVQRAPVDADADRLAVVDGDAHDRLEVLVVALRADVAGVDAVLGERAAPLPGTRPAAGGRCSGSRRSAARPRPGRPACAGSPARRAAAPSLFTVTRTSSEPAWASAATCSAVASASAVSVLVIDCTTTGWREPILTPPTLTVTVSRRPGRCGSPSTSGGSGPRRPAVPTAGSTLIPADRWMSKYVIQTSSAHQGQETHQVDRALDGHADPVAGQALDDRDRDPPAVHAAGRAAR